MIRFVVAGFLGIAATAMGSSPSVSQLQPGDRLHVSYHSAGCFHDQTYEIDFQRAASVTARSAHRTVSLSPKEVAGIDQLFRFYSSRPRGGCTTQDDIAITCFRGAQKLFSEHYLDGSCATDDMKNVTRLYDIAKKLGVEHDTKRQQAMQRTAGRADP